MAHLVAQDTSPINVEAISGMIRNLLGLICKQCSMEPARLVGGEKYGV